MQSWPAAVEAAVAGKKKVRREGGREGERGRGGTCCRLMPDRERLMQSWPAAVEAAMAGRKKVGTEGGR